MHVQGMWEEYGGRQIKSILCNTCLTPSINDLGMRLISEMTQLPVLTYLKLCHTGLRFLWHKHNYKRFSLFLGRCPAWMESAR